MSLTPIDTWIPGFNPTPQITPFTYRDGETYLEQIERIKCYVNDTLVDFINTNFTTISDSLQDEVNALITTVNDQIAAIVGNSITAQDSVVEGIVSNPASLTRVELNSLFAPYALSATVTSLNTAVTALQALTGTGGRLSDASLQAEFALASALTTANTNITNNTTAITTLNTLVGTGRLSDASLQAEFATVTSLGTTNTNVSTLTTLTSSGRLSDSQLKLEFAQLSNGIEDFTTVALLLASTPVTTPQYAMANNAPGLLFRYDAGAWAPYGEGFFTTASARDAALTVPLPNMRVFLTTPGMRMEYVGTFGSGGRWQKVGINKPTAAVATNGTATINDDGSISCVFTAAGTLILTNCMAQLASTDINDFDISWSSSAAQYVTMKQASGGVVDSTTSGYDFYGISENQAGTFTSGATTSLNAAQWPFMNINAATYIAFECTLEVRHAMDSTKSTRMFERATTVTTLGTTENAFDVRCNNRATTAFDGLQFSASGAGTLNIKSRPRA